MRVCFSKIFKHFYIIIHYRYFYINKVFVLKIDLYYDSWRQSANNYF